MWIDAIFINQGDIKEKNHQVRHMAEIYNLSTYVISWLGKGSDDVKCLFRSMTQSYKKSLTTHSQRLHPDDWDRLKTMYWPFSMWNTGLDCGLCPKYAKLAC